jgi:ABC-type lipoprotein release transport system permease subunit
MKMLLQLAWRNIWRHPGRSAALLAAVVVGIWAGMVMAGLVNGWTDQRMTRLVETETSHLQVHHPEFLTEREARMEVSDAPAILEWLDQNPAVKAATARTLTDGMIQSPVTASGVRVKGVLPDRERLTSSTHQYIVEGTYVDEADIRNPIVIGGKLATRLGIGVGNRVVLTFQDVNNELTSASFAVVGLFRTGSSAFDERNVIVRAEDLYELIARRPVFHEIASLMYDVEEAPALTAELNERFTGVRAQTWFELSPELRLMNDMAGQFTYYIMLIILGALAFGILNTMLMAIFERVHELGMLMAVGMTRPRVFGMIMTETVLLTVVGSSAGIGLALLTITWFGTRGLDLTPLAGESLAAVGYDAVVFPFITPDIVIGVTLLVVLTAVLASIYPSIKALRLKPAEAIRE